MKHEAQLIPSPMSSERLREMRARVRKGLPLAVPSDQPAIVESVRHRGKKVAKNGHAVLARGKRNHSTNESRFDDEGEEIEVETDWSLIDRYLRTEIGTQAALAALATWKRAWGR